MYNVNPLATTPVTSQPQEPKEIDFGTLASVVWRERLFVIFVVILFIAAAVGYVLRVAVPMYPATAVIEVSSEEQRVMTDIESVVSGASSDTASLNTQAVVLKSRLLVGTLVDRLNLVADPEFNPELQEPSPTSISGVLQLIGLTQPETWTETSLRNRVIDNLQDTITVSNQRQTMVFNVTSTTTDPDKSALISNTLAEIYIESQTNEKFEANQRASAFLSKRAAELKQALEQQESARNAYYERDSSITPEALTAASGQLRDLRTRLSDLETSKAIQAQTLTRLAALRDDPLAFSEVAQDSQLSQLIRRRGAGDASVAALVERSLARQATEVERTDQKIVALRASEADLNAQVARQGEELIELQQLERELEATRLLYESFLTRLKETNVQEGLETSDSRLLSEAVPRPPSSPRTGLTVLVFAVLGLFASGGWVLLRELRFSGFRTSDDLQNTVGVTVLGSVPATGTKARGDTVRYFRDKPNSVTAEAVRNLRTSVLMSNVDKPPKVILLTSSIPGEGKTTLSMALAANMSGLNKRVLLIEADLRRRTFNQYFDTSRTASVMDVIERPEDLGSKETFIHELGVDVIVGAKSNTNAADVFASDRFRSIIEQARTSYDYIIIDSPPVLAVPDARVIRPICDACLYVVRWSSTSKLQVAQGLQMFSSVGLNVTGLVLNQIDSRQMQRYGYGGQYGYDAYQSKYYDN